ncbi:anti-phage dCTP deaminase [Sphingomonas alba]|uniref:Deaminase n=1 Tax=Sphingomonas alba TaxID=2908208 RepID=A0ABT0RLM6_9SPHN|nr:anti-phage dCTP deaminase [Sphingomonas alba]MCL6683543.1 deaminase [Sphingomonas alba]
MASTSPVANDLDDSTAPKPKFADIDDRLSLELVIALVGPVGSGCTTTYETLSKELADEYGYDTVHIVFSDLIKDHAHEVFMDFPAALSASDRIDRFQTAGNALRSRFADRYLADRAIEKIAIERDQRKGYEAVGDTRVVVPQRRAYFLDSLKNPAELKRLRQVYGDLLWVVSVFAPEDVRLERLKRKGMEDSDARYAMTRDYDEELNSGQKVSKIAHQANYFIRNSSENKEDLKAPCERFLQTIFGIELHTPTYAEKGMMEAASAAVRSACLSRQVGAAIYDQKGDLLGVGCNDVPKSGGGLYGEDGGADHRCFRWQENECHNDKHKLSLATNIVAAVGTTKENATDLVAEAMEGGVANLIEFSRSVHAEMEAIVSVARLGTGSTIGATLYTTTFPCHNCARHIVAAGVSTVYYVEPYSKSLALELHSDSITLDESLGEKVRFLQYEGFAPRTSLRLFSSSGRERKENGKFVEANPREAKPIFATPLDSYTMTENLVISKLNAGGDGEGDDPETAA